MSERLRPSSHGPLPDDDTVLVHRPHAVQRDVPARPVLIVEREAVGPLRVEGDRVEGDDTLLPGEPILEPEREAPLAELGIPEMIVALSRGAAVEARVLDATGAPVVDVTVAARRQAPSDAPAPMPFFATETDDRGYFPLGGLPAGRYEVRVLGFDGPSSIVLPGECIVGRRGVRNRFRGSRHLKFARADQEGAFQVNGLPPGSDLVAAVDRIEGTPGTGEWQDPALLEQLVPQARRVTLTQGERMTTTLRLIRR